MLKYPCLVLDHDDTVVQSEATINYPFFCYIMDRFRPGTTITLKEYIQGCFHPGFVEMCRQWYNFTDEELQEEHKGWREYVRSHIPSPYPGIAELIHKQKEAGGKVCVVSHSCKENISRDYLAHFGLEPDMIFGTDLPKEQCKPNTYPLEKIMETYGFFPQDLLIVDDLKPAVQMARNAGVDIAFAAWSKEEVPEIIQEMTALCDYAFHSPTELTEFLFN